MLKRATPEMRQFWICLMQKCNLEISWLWACLLRKCFHHGDRTVLYFLVGAHPVLKFVFTVEVGSLKMIHFDRSHPFLTYRTKAPSLDRKVPACHSSIFAICDLWSPHSQPPTVRIISVFWKILISQIFKFPISSFFSSCSLLEWELKIMAELRISDFGRFENFKFPNFRWGLSEWELLLAELRISNSGRIENSNFLIPSGAF